jgi:hypothetical protein
LEIVMAAPTIAPAPDPLRDLASRIFVELVCRNVVVSENAAQIKVSPDNLARISFKLAEAFVRTEIELKESTAPKNQDFDMKAAELPEWKSAKP